MTESVSSRSELKHNPTAARLVMSSLQFIRKQELEARFVLAKGSIWGASKPIWITEFGVIVNDGRQFRCR